MTKRIKISGRYIGGFNPNKAKKPDVQPQATAENKRTKGPIVKFSDDSRMRLIELLSRIPEDQPPEVFVTLTYAVPGASWDIKTHVDNLRRCLERNYPGSWFVYRIDRSEKWSHRPHLHMLGRIGVVQKPNIQFGHWIDMTWRRISGVQDSTDCKTASKTISIRTVRDIESRFSYLVKEEKEWPTCIWDGVTKFRMPTMTGKRWGLVNKKNLPQLPMQEIEVTDEQYERIKAELGVHFQQRRADFLTGKTQEQKDAIIKKRDKSAMVFGWRPDFGAGLLPEDVVEAAKAVAKETHTATTASAVAEHTNPQE